MGWFSRVKEFFVRVFKKEEKKVVESSVAVAEVEAPQEEIVIAVPVVPQESLSKKAREVRALGPADLVKVPEKCDHVRAFTRQTWVRVADRKFELRNEMMCVKCKDSTTEAIG